MLDPHLVHNYSQFKREKVKNTGNPNLLRLSKAI